MSDENNKSKSLHNLILKERKYLAIAGVTDVDSFDEQKIVAYTDYGALEIKGQNLHIAKINLDTGDLILDGEISELIYSNQKNNNQSLFSKLFK